MNIADRVKAALAQRKADDNDINAHDNRVRLVMGPRWVPVPGHRKHTYHPELRVMLNGQVLASDFAHYVDCVEYCKELCAGEYVFVDLR